MSLMKNTSPEIHQTVVRQHVTVPARDDTLLAIDLCRPAQVQPSGGTLDPERRGLL